MALRSMSLYNLMQIMQIFLFFSMMGVSKELLGLLLSSTECHCGFLPFNVLCYCFKYMRVFDLVLLLMHNRDVATT